MSSYSRIKIPTKNTKKEFHRNGCNGFRNKEEYAWWSHFFDKMPIVIERAVQINSLDDFPHRQAFVQPPRWVEYLVNSGNMCNITICTEFVTSLIQDDEDDDYSFMALVSNRFVHLNPTTLGRNP